MTDELLDLLKELNAANTCGECEGGGKNKNTWMSCPECGSQFYVPKEKANSTYCPSCSTKMKPDFEKCRTCHGTGAKVPALNETEWVIFSDNPKVRHARSGLSLIDEKYKGEYLPDPTLEEVLEMLPGNIKHKGQTLYFFLVKGDENYRASYEPDYEEVRRLIDFIIPSCFSIIDMLDKSPLIAALKLLKWWLEQ